MAVKLSMVRFNRVLLTHNVASYPPPGHAQITPHYNFSWSLNHKVKKALFNKYIKIAKTLGHY